jgi:riboflavin kinase / FMN adenylyltransferase
MEVVTRIEDLGGRISYGVVAIGVFDGVHLGHQEVIRRVVARARRNAGAAVVLTFAPHPQKVINPASAPPLLQTFEQQAELLEKLGVDFLLRLQFTRSLSLLSPEEFVSGILAPTGFREIHVGENFRFGKGRQGDFARLQMLGLEAGFVTHPAPVATLKGSRISSTRIRRMLIEGRVQQVKRLLGRPYEMRGTVVRGARRGAALGFATANLKAENELIPAIGVYVSRVRVDGHQYLGATNIGFRPTVHAFGEPLPTIETHLIGYEGDLYGRAMAVDFCFRLREERRFHSVEALILQVRKDILSAIRYARRAGPRINPQEGYVASRRS